MNKLRIAFLALLFATAARGADFQITAILQATNNPATSSNLTVNAGTANTRTWTNDVTANPAIFVQVTNSTAAAITNLLTHFGTYPVATVTGGPRVVFALNSTNTSCLNITAPLNTNLTVTLSGNWGFVFYVTNTYTPSTPILTSTNAMSAPARTNGANALVNLLAAAGATGTSNSIPLNNSALRNYTDTNTAQVLGNKTLIGPVISGGRITGFTNAWGTNVSVTNVTIYLVSIFGGTYSGTISNLTNGNWFGGYLSNSILDKPTTTNLVNAGNAIRSPGTGGNSLQLGSNAQAIATQSIAVGNDALAAGSGSMAIGISTIASNSSATAVGNAAKALTNNATAIGEGAIASGASAFAGGQAIVTGAAAIAIGTEDTAASGANAIALGPTTVASGSNSLAFGTTAQATHALSFALGAAATTTATNQGMLGTSAHTIVVPGVLQAATTTNSTFRGTNNWNGDIAYTARTYSSLVNGFNTGIILGTNHVVELSGGTTISTIASFVAERDGSEHEVRLSGAITNIVANESGAESGSATYRITTGTGGDIALTNQPAYIRVRYRTTANRWELISWSR